MTEIIQATEDIEIERDFCLASLVRQAEDRQIDAEADGYLIEQINDAHSADVEQGAILECRVGGCAMSCLVKNEGGILSVIDTAGKSRCDI